MCFSLAMEKYTTTPWMRLSHRLTTILIGYISFADKMIDHANAYLTDLVLAVVIMTLLLSGTMVFLLAEDLVTRRSVTTSSGALTPGQFSPRCLKAAQKAMRSS